MRVAITAATKKEIERVEKAISALRLSHTHEISFHITGIGMMPSCFSISQLIYEQKPDLIIQVGIAGAYAETYSIGEVVAVEVEYIGDWGVEEAGVFKDVFEMNLLEQNDKPFNKKQLINPHLLQINLLKLDEVIAVTVNEITTQQKRIHQLEEMYTPAIESMEGAALHYSCLNTSTPFIQIRSISNMIGERDKAKWNFELAFENLAATVSKYIQKFVDSNS